MHMTVPHLRRSPVLDRHTRGIQTDWLVLKLSVVTLVGRRSEYSTKFHKGGLRPEAQPLTHLSIPSSTEKVPL